MKKALLLLLILGLAACNTVSGADWHQVTVVSASGSHTFTVEIADDDQERQRGLMYRRDLAPDAGMLFLFEREAPRSFWMHNTYVSLDIIYINAEGHIVSIAQHTTPLSDRSIPSLGSAIAVLEVLAGTSERLAFAPGDEVQHPFFETLRDGQ